MNKFLYGIGAVVLILALVFFFMWRNVSIKNEHLTTQNNALLTQIEQVEKIISERDSTINAQNKKYQALLNSVKYNDCENLPVSQTLLDAAKELQQ